MPTALANLDSVVRSCYVASSILQVCVPVPSSVPCGVAANPTVDRQQPLQCHRAGPAHLCRAPL